MTPAELVQACRVPSSVPSQEKGLWTIRRLPVPEMDVPARHFLGLGDVGEYTILGRWTDATLHLPYGDIVMEDSPRELRRHLPILLRAHGRVLVSGLGLGCVLRGLLAKPEVEHIDLIEIDAAIVDMVWPEFAGDPRVMLHAGDALTYPWPDSARWDFSWHDVWTEDDSLDLLHCELLARYRDRCRWQGAWQLKRTIKRIWPDPLLGAARRRSAA